MHLWEQDKTGVFFMFESQKRTLLIVRLKLNELFTCSTTIGTLHISHLLPCTVKHNQKYNKSKYTHDFEFLSY